MNERISFRDAQEGHGGRFGNSQLAKHITEDLGNRHTKDYDGPVIHGMEIVKHDGADSGGLAVGNYGAVNKLYEEEKFHANQGHGFAAERANHLYDILHGKDAKIVGDDNAKNGADRIVDGLKIQTKYCRSGQECVNACFENGKFRYYDKGGPMQIEVPSDMYDAAIVAMEEKIKAGQVDGVTNAEEAKNIIRKGHFTYQQAKNIAKAGTVESLTYDAINGTIMATSAFGITTGLTLATSLWGGKEYKDALKEATYAGLKVGETSFVTTVLASQLSKAGLNSALVNGSEAIASLMGPKAAAVLVNAFRNGNNIYGAAAMKSAAKLIRGNAITGIVSVGVFSAEDIGHMFQGKISGKQCFKNVTNTAAKTAGGIGGWVGCSAAGSAIGGTVGTFFVPGAGTAIGAAVGKIIGGLAGSVVGGEVAGKVSEEVVGKFIEDDAVKMENIIQDEFEAIAKKYLLTEDEANNVVDKLSKKLDEKTLMNMFKSDDREQFAKELLEPLVTDEMAKRQLVLMSSDGQTAGRLKVGDKFVQENADEMIDIIQHEFGTMAQEYLLTKNEANNVVDTFSRQFNEMALMNMFGNNAKGQFAEGLLEPIITAETAKRQKIKEPSNKDMLEQLKVVLEEMGDVLEGLGGTS